MRDETIIDHIPKVCIACGKIIYKASYASSVKQWGRRKYCSAKCSRTGRPGVRPGAPLKEAFHSYYEAGPGCWDWRGPMDQASGYGLFHYKYKGYRAHVMALKLDGRPVPKDKCGLHHCDNRKCVNPAHLYVGTRGDNMRDAVNRRRLNYGEANHNTKLTQEEVDQMRSLNAPALRSVGHTVFTTRQLIK